MRRTFLLIAVAFLLLGQVAVGYAVDLLRCEDECADEGPAGCSGDEACGSCCFHPRTLLPQAAARMSLDPTWSALASSEPAVPPADPREILHVPKSLLA